MKTYYTIMETDENGKVWYLVRKDHINKLRKIWVERETFFNWANCIGYKKPSAAWKWHQELCKEDPCMGAYYMSCKPELVSVKTMK